MQDTNAVAIAIAMIAAADAAVLDGGHTGHSQPVEESIVTAVAQAVTRAGYEVEVGKHSFPLRNGVRGLSVTVRPPARSKAAIERVATAVADGMREQGYSGATVAWLESHAGLWADHDGNAGLIRRANYGATQFERYAKVSTADAEEVRRVNGVHQW
jgi:hypothetical protein